MRRKRLILINSRISVDADLRESLTISTSNFDVGVTLGCSIARSVESVGQAGHASVVDPISLQNLARTN